MCKKIRDISRICKVCKNSKHNSEFPHSSKKDKEGFNFCDSNICFSCTNEGNRLKSEWKRNNDVKPSIGDKCPICLQKVKGKNVKSDDGRTRKWVLDHDDYRNNVHGWVCNRCNTSFLAKAEDMSVLKRAYEWNTNKKPTNKKSNVMNDSNKENYLRLFIEINESDISESEKQRGDSIIFDKVLDEKVESNVDKSVSVSELKSNNIKDYQDVRGDNHKGRLSYLSFAPKYQISDNGNIDIDEWVCIGNSSDILWEGKVKYHKALETIDAHKIVKGNGRTKNIYIPKEYKERYDSLVEVG